MQSDGFKNSFIFTEQIKTVLAMDEQIQKLAQETYQQQSLLVMGRGYNYATCLEGALVCSSLPFSKQALVFFTCLQYKSIENNVGKEEIARNEQFLLFPVFSTYLESFLSISPNLKLSSADI